MNRSILILKKIRVGFQNREDTYTKRLAYVIYYDNKGKLRKEPSWNSWRDKAIEPEEYDNVPTEGFVLNKKVGGYAGSWGNFRQAYVRVYDPRGFEFEITVPNLLYILEHTSSIKGKGLEGEFVYAWDGPDLLLLPTCAPDYDKIRETNERRAEITIKNADLKIGATYLNKHGKELVYMGRFEAYDSGYYFGGKFFPTYREMYKYAQANNLPLSSYRGGSIWRRDNLYDFADGPVGKMYFFYNPSEYGWNGWFEIYKTATGRFIDVVSDIPAPNYTELFDRLEHCKRYSPVDKSRNVFRKCTAEEIEEVCGKNPFWFDYTTVVDGERVKIRLERTAYDGTTMYRIYCKDSAAVSLLRTKFNYTEERNSLGYTTGQFDPLPMKTILEAFPPYCTEIYLENGKFYEKRFVTYE